MSFSITIFGLFTALFALSDAGPLSPRGQSLNTFVGSPNDLSQTNTYFAPNWPTCGNDHTMTDLGLSTTITVDVKDCDTVIDTICNAAVKEASGPNQMKSLSSTQGTCQGYILFSQWTLADPFDYNKCVSSFQSITETCMLMDAPFKNYASDKHQAGVQNMFHNPAATPPSTHTWSAVTIWNLYPGYMMGPPGYFGDVSLARDAGDI